ncbi:MAG: phospholipid carrier-dependent glycosyltransferase [Terracidiphilus sp.]|nr:phospholipid carrier-dependent glycosyltransferase [Terracidiphilus sp.]
MHLCLNPPHTSTLAAAFGALLIPVMYYLAREFRIRRPASALVAWLVTFDMLNATEARLILTDSQLVFYMALSLLLAVKFWKRRNYFTCAQIAGGVGKRAKGAPVMPLTPGLHMPAWEEVAWSVTIGLAFGASVRCARLYFSGCCVPR